MPKNKSLSELALEAESIKAGVKTIEEFIDMLKDDGSYFAITQEYRSYGHGLHMRDRTFYDMEIFRKELKENTINFFKKQKKKWEKKILAVEKKIQQGAIDSITEDSRLPKEKKRNFFNKLYK